MRAITAWYDPATANAFKRDRKGGEPACVAERGSERLFLCLATLPQSLPWVPARRRRLRLPTSDVSVDTSSYTMSAAKAVATARVNSFAYGTVNLQVYQVCPPALLRP